MQEDFVSTDRALGIALDFDVLQDGTWVGIFQRSHGLFVASSDGSNFCVGEALPSPRVRFVDRHRVVVVSGNASRSFISSLDGSQCLLFDSGHGFADVVVLGDLIAITYFDEGVFSGDPASAQGIAFFDFEGHLFAGYQSLFGSDAVFIDGCHAACRVDHDTIAFCTLPHFALLCANPRARLHSAYPLPGELDGASAISLRGDTAFVYDPYDHKQRIFEWCVNTDRVAGDVGRHSGRLRGLEYGRFLSVGDHGFTVISCGTG
jgi:hypothetical protein